MSYSEKMLADLEAGKMESAQKNFDLAVKNDDDQILYSLAEELYAMGFIQQAQTIYEKLLKKYPDEDQLKTTLADIAVTNGKNDEALNYLSQIKPESNAYAESLLTQADVYQTMGLYEVSESKLQEAIKLFPDEPVMTFALAELYFAIGDYQEALDLYQELKQQGIDNFSQVNITARIAASLAQLGKFEEAMKLYDQINEAELTQDDKFSKGVVEFQSQKYKDAIVTLSELAEEDPNYTSLYLYLANAQEKNGELDAAMRTVQTGLGLDMYNVNLAKLGVDLSQKLNNEELSEEMLKKILTVEPNNTVALLELSNLYILQNENQKNLDLLNEVQSAEEDIDPQFYWNLAHSLAAEDKLEDAQANYLLAYQNFKNNPDFLKELGDFFISIGRIAEAKSSLKRYLQFVPTDFETQERYNSLTDA